MALAFVQSASAGKGTAGTSCTATLGAGPTQNNLLIASLFTKGVAATNPTGFTTAIEVVNSTNDDRLRLTYKVAGAGESASIGFTGLSSGAGTESAVGVMEFSGNATSSPLDQTASTGFTAAVETLSSGTTGTLAQAAEVACAAFGLRNNVVTSPSLDNSYTLRSHQAGGTGTATATIIDGYRITAATTAQDTDASWTTAAGAMGVIATFKELIAGGAVPRNNLMMSGMGR